MRGTDFRSRIGITLVICKPFTNEREVGQALGRVGRFGDPCKRYRSRAVDQLFEHASDVSSLTSLIRFSQSLSTKARTQTKASIDKKKREEKLVAK